MLKGPSSAKSPGGGHDHQVIVRKSIVSGSARKVKEQEEEAQSMGWWKEKWPWALEGDFFFCILFGSSSSGPFYVH